MRRIFAIPVRGDDAGSEILAGPLAEWLPAEERWRTYRDDELIVDPCLFEPLPVRALLDAVEADDAVAQALLDKGNRVLMRHTERVRHETRADQTRKVLHLLLRDRGVALDADAHTHIAACDDVDVLERWVTRAVQATSASDLFGDD